jgi:hypothetical protein
MTLVLLLLLSFGGLLIYWCVRPNRAFVNPSLQMEDWDVVKDGRHNSNTDLIFWRGRFYLAHAASPFHMGSKRCRLVLRRSADARLWEKVAELGMPGEDIRDPKFAALGDRLFLYALPNHGLKATPYGTIYSVSDDGITWPGFVAIEPDGWLFWRPKTRDGATWYVPAYWHRHGQSILLNSSDGIDWTRVAEIHAGDGNDETDIEFLPDGRMLATARLEMQADSPFGHSAACTLLAVAAPPYREWKKRRSYVTRLDGPNLFAVEGRIFAVARHQPGNRGRLTQLGSMVSRKRTSLYLVEENRLVYLSDLPSAGDTSYAGVVLQDGFLYASYYTSDITRDYPWMLGMLLASHIRIAKVSLASLGALAERRAGKRPAPGASRLGG